MKRVYLSRPHYGSPLPQVAVLAIVANSGTTLTRWGDLGGAQTQAPADAKLRLLDLSYLYDDRPVRIVSTSKETLKLSRPHRRPGAAIRSAGSLGSHEVTHIRRRARGAAHCEKSSFAHRVLADARRAVRCGEIPCGWSDLSPFDMRVYSHGTGFKPVHASRTRRERMLDTVDPRKTDFRANHEPTRKADTKRNASGASRPSETIPGPGQ